MQFQGQVSALGNSCTKTNYKTKHLQRETYLRIHNLLSMP